MAFTALVVGAVVPLVTVSLTMMTLCMFGLSLIACLFWILRGGESEAVA
jgi:DHA1 family bicyclomycin/chloramphenicol resistance-like MFS transporter